MKILANEIKTGMIIEHNNDFSWIHLTKQQVCDLGCHSMFTTASVPNWNEVEIHRTRGAPLKDYNVDLQKKSRFFRVRMLSLRYVGFCKKISMRRQKRITFKKVYQKIFICREDMSFSRAKKC